MAVDNELKKEHFEELKKNTRYNYQIADFYLDRFIREGFEIPDGMDNPDDIFKYFENHSHSDNLLINSKRAKWLSKSKNIYNCCKYLDLDCYLKFKIKDVKRINLCRDKFCLNCQKKMANERQVRFVPELDNLRKDYEVFHLIMTVPNCKDSDFKAVVDNMYDKFKYLIRYFNGIKPIKGVDF